MCAVVDTLVWSTKVKVFRLHEVPRPSRNQREGGGGGGMFFLLTFHSSRRRSPYLNALSIQLR